MRKMQYASASLGRRIARNDVKSAYFVRSLHGISVA